MQWLLAVAWLGAIFGLTGRIQGADRRCSGGEALTIAVAGSLVIVGIAATLTAALGVFSAASVAVLVGGSAIVCLRGGRRVCFGALGPEHLGLALIVLLGISLRTPLHPAELAGRDPGTYVLQARHILRTGSLHHHDALLAAATRAGDRAGAGDLLGLLPIEREGWREGVYEGPYRPGLYLRDRASGAVAPQFLQMHPALLAVSGLLFGPGYVGLILYVYALVAAAALWWLALRLWPGRWWPAALASGLYAAAPLVIWVARAPLSEPLIGALLLACALALKIGERRWAAALLLGGAGWVRGNVWLLAPLVLAILWLRPRSRGGWRAPAVVCGLLLGSAMLHAEVVFPYLYDELRRQLGGWAPIRPAGLMLGAPLAIGLWWAVDLGIGRSAAAQRRLSWCLTRLPWVFAGAAALSVIVYVRLRIGGGGERPFSRLDAALPAFGPWLLGAAAVGLGIVARRRGAVSEDGAWWAALMVVPTATLALYAQRNLPQAGLYYYGRYLAPELAPALFLTATAAVVAVSDRLARRSRRLGAVGVVGLGGGLWLSVAGPLALAPITLATEQAGAERLIEDLAARIPAGAVVIAGGEGWLSAHTWNQVGGALAMGHGVQVLPYRSAEATYAALHELLLAGPQARAEAAPPVLLLLNEATQAHREGPEGPKIAAIDDRLPAPFRARALGLFELFTDRLTPTMDALPTRITRSELRLGLFAVEIDAAQAAAISGWTMRGGAAIGPGDLDMSGDTWTDGNLCLDRDRELVIRLAPRGGPLALALLATGGAARRTMGWRLTVDGEVMDLSLPHTPIRERETLGPFVREQGPRELRLRGSREAAAGAICPFGGLAELRLLPAEIGAVWPAERGSLAISYAPPHAHGHAAQASRWARGRSLSRLRPGSAPRPTSEGLAIRLEAPGRTDVAFAPIFGPEGEVLWLLHLLGARLDPAARLELWIDGALLATIDPPDRSAGNWTAPPAVTRAAPGALARARLVLVDAAPGDFVLVRDLAVVSREEL